MNRSPVVILVGGPRTGKTSFFNQYTSSKYSGPTLQVNVNSMISSSANFVIVDTPGVKSNRDPLTYSWTGIFGLADVVLVFENWIEDEINGEPPIKLPKFMTWSGDNFETVKRIEEYLQGIKC